VDGLKLMYGASKVDRLVEAADGFLVAFRQDWGLRYLGYQPSTPPGCLLPDHLAVTILINSRVSAKAFMSVQDHGADLDLTSLPSKALEDTTDEDSQTVAEVIAAMAHWPGFAASVATKILHKKRPALIPILDNQAIFGAYMNLAWPERRSSADSIYAVTRIKEALDWITEDLTRRENRDVWPELAAIEPTRSRIELFDMVWWMYFRSIEPVVPGTAV
jgi:hypothetical protein